MSNILAVTLILSSISMVALADEPTSTTGVPQDSILSEESKQSDSNGNISVEPTTDTDSNSENPSSQDSSSDELGSGEPSNADDQIDSQDNTSDLNVEKKNPDTNPGPENEDDVNAQYFDELNVLPRAAATEAEPNNTRAKANKVTVGTTITGYVNPKGDIDCFLLIPTVSQKVTFKLTGPSNKDYDLYLQDNTGGLLARSDGTTSSESISYDVKKGIQYYAVVNSGYSHYSSTAKYTLQITGSGGSQQTSNTVAVNARKQEKTLWCWATTVQMMAETEGYAKTQASIVTSIFGSAVNQTGSVVDQVNALKKISSSIFKNADYDNCNSTSTYKTWVSDNILDGKTVSIACCPVGTLNTGHSYLAYSVDTSANTVELIDPWSTATTRIRIARNELLNGFYCTALNKSVQSVTAVHY